MATPAAEPAASSTTDSSEPAPVPAQVNASEPTQLVAPTEGLLRFSTAGSVDDGKSTLIGRLLYDSQSVLEDQLASVRKSNVNRSGGPIDFALLTDGLRAEREQGITIDVAYRYFSTPRRKFIIADTPGHEQYTRNMATGASTADASVVLMDATKGVLRQSRRHAYIANLLGVQHIIAAVNKMDLVGFSQEVFERIAAEFREFAEQLGIKSLYAVPVSALDGDNIVRRSLRTPWFEGPALLEYLEGLRVSDTAASGPLRFPVQYVIRPDSTFRGFAGQVASGVLRAGATVVAIPSGIKTKVKSIVTFEEELEQAGPGESVNLTLEDEIDISRGDVIVDDDRRPSVGTEFQATVVWMHADPLDLHKIYLLKHTTRTVRARFKQVRQRIDINTLEKSPAASLDMNDIAEVDLKTTLPLFFENRTMGSFIVIDQHTNATVAAGIIGEAIITSPAVARATASATHTGRSTKEERILRFGHPSAAVWLKGYPKIAEMVERRLFEEGWFVQLVGPMDFLSHELVTVTKAYRMSGAITVYAPLDDGTNQAQAVRAIFGPDAFFELPNSGLSDEEAVTQIVDALYKWRDTHSDPNQRRK
jgi:bifunctional enzyme CysN/CysC/sulfate adenylyltransferase subunit 1